MPDHPGDGESKLDPPSTNPTEVAESAEPAQPAAAGPQPVESFAFSWTGLALWCLLAGTFFVLLCGLESLKEAVLGR
ncbi:MAG: hypothetical protein LIP77_10140 [Planctomycetes bacterium]|nr:hypothetical protein [Planctomycetota bacterium]